MEPLRAGVYKHYKGGMYLVLGVARHTETNETLVMYVSLGVKPGPQMFARPYDMFTETVIVNGIEKPRFLYIGEDTPAAVSQWYDPLSGYRGADRVDD